MPRLVLGAFIVAATLSVSALADQVQVSKASGYGVITAPVGVDVAKASGYAIITVPTGASVAKASAYAIVAAIVDDGNACTTDSYDPISGVHHVPVPAGASCADGNACNGVEVCDGAAVCLEGLPPVLDDGNACTQDTCDPVAGVLHVPLDAGASCSDGNLCNGIETCDGAGQCVAGTSLVVDDGLPCTADACDSIAGVIHIPVSAGTVCAEGNVCEGNGGVCDFGGTCQLGTVPVIDDRNPCTIDSCDPMVGVLHQPVEGGTSCSDGDFCNGLEVCDGAGACTPGEPPFVDDGNECTIDWCDPSAGVVHLSESGSSCSDDDVCNGDETCDNGSCQAGTPPELDDDDACTADACDPDIGVTHTAISVDDGDPCTTDACDRVAGVSHTPIEGCGTAACLPVNCGADGCAVPDPPPPDADPEDEACHQSGSDIDCHNQVLGETIPITGTPYALHYSSARVPGNAGVRTISIPLTDTYLPSQSLIRIDLRVRIAGRDIAYSVDPPFSPNQSFAFAWDGLNADGHAVEGRATLSVTIDYVYQAAYNNWGAAQKFYTYFTTGETIFVGLTDPAHFIVTASRTWVRNIGTWIQDGDGLGGWALDAHHAYDRATRTLFTGGGESLSERSDAARVISPLTGPSGIGPFEGASAAETNIGEPFGLAVGSNGALYVAQSDTWNCTHDCDERIIAIDPNGMIHVVAGGTSGVVWGRGAEGLPATLADFWPVDVAVDAAGVVYFVDIDSCGIRSVTPDGTLHNIAGNDECAFSGDGGAATEASLFWPWSLALDTQGAIFVLEQHRIRRIGADGVISTIAGSGVCGNSGDGGPAIDATVCGALGYKLAAGPDGSLYLPGDSRFNLRSQIHLGGVVRRIGPNGAIETIAGSGVYGYSGDGGPALDAYFGSIDGIAVGPDGTVYITDNVTTYNTDHEGAPEAARVRAITPAGIVWTIAGDGRRIRSAAEEHRPATDYSLGYPWVLAVDPGGTVYIGDDDQTRILRVVKGMAVGPSEALIGSRSGDQAFIFDSSGNHLRTIDGSSGALLYLFAYTDTGLLASVTDRNGRTTTVERTADGTPIAIVAPYGQRTTLAVDGNGRLSTVTNPAAHAYQLTHGSHGLLETLVDPRGNRHQFTYSATGQLIRDDNPAGGFKTLSRTEQAQAYTVVITNALGRNTTYSVQKVADGGRIRTNTSASGNQTVESFAADGSSTTTYPDGVVVETVKTLDPRFGASAAAESSVTTTPSGLQRSLTVSRTATLADPANPLSVTTLTESVTVNGRASVSTYDAVARTLTSQTPAGRTTVTLHDSSGRVVETRPPGYSTGAAWPVQYEYDANGRLFRATQGGRTVVIGYNAEGYLETLTDPLLRTTRFWYDLAGRVVDEDLFGDRHVTFGYDRSGNLTSLTPPSRPAHVFEYTPMNQTASYTPPVASGTGLVATSYGYNLDGALAQVLLADESTVTQGHDAAGRLASVTTARGTTIVGYDANGRVGALTAPDGGQVSFSYDGFLKTSETWTGAVAGSVGYAYDSDFRVTEVSVDGASASYQYDADSLLTQTGTLAITHDAAAGWITGTAAGQVTTSQSFSQYGELHSFSANANGAEVFSYTLDRDATGRIFRKTETIGGTTTIYGYEYDEAGRLWRFAKNGTAVSVYSYDANGNRLAGPVAQTGTYDDQDRMLAYGDATYTCGPNGDLRSKTENGQITSYAYDALGNLVATSLPDGTLVEYVMDGKNRRIGKKLNGQLVEGFLYEGQLRPVAWLNGAGQLYARFVYGTHVNVPEYMVTVGGTFRIVTDHLGSPRLVIDTASGAVAQRIDYDEWGNVLHDTAPGFQPFGFAGGLYDRDTGLVRFGARDYDPSVGRWTNKDPLRFNGGALNLFEYSRNDPVNWQDPSGKVLPLVIAAGAALAPWAEAAAAALIGAWAGNTIYDYVSQAARERRSSRPKDCPRGTKPIDQSEWSGDHDAIEMIKRGVDAAPGDWTGITPDGEVVTTNPVTGEAEIHGPASDYVPSGKPSSGE